MRLNAFVAPGLIIAAVVGGALALKANRSTAIPAAATALTTTTNTLPRFVEVGSTTCAPCKVMAGVMVDLEKRYPGQMKIEFVNINQQPEEADRLNVQIIPTQIFYAPDGRELFRHVGVFKSDEIIAKWAEFGFRLTAVEG